MKFRHVKKEIVNRYTEHRTNDDGSMRIVVMRELACGHRQEQSRGGSSARALDAICKKCKLAMAAKQFLPEPSFES